MSKSINNWRVGLEFPNDIITDEMSAVEYLYEDENGKTCNSFSDEHALAAMLLDEAIFLNSNWWEENWPEEAKKTVALCVSTNDIFTWGCADAESLPYDEIEEVYRYWIKDRSLGTAVWAIIRNKEMPQRPVESSIRKAGIWDLDALQKEHGLRANYYDGISHVLAQRKRAAYCEWCAAQRKAPLPFDGGWWEGWKEYVAAHPNWCDEEWKASDKKACNEWRLANGYG